MPRSYPGEANSFLTERSSVSAVSPPARDPGVAADPAPPVPLTPVSLTPVPLTLAGRRGRPPRHLADLDLAGRRAAVAELGQPPFRAAQLSRHYFGRYTQQPADMTDLPAASREALAGALLPPLLTADRE